MLISEYIKYFEDFGDMAVPYLQDHADRFLKTKELLQPTLDENPNVVILDVASHWLHNAYLYAKDGYKVYALDQEGGEISARQLVRFADEHEIDLLPCKALSDPVELDVLNDDTIGIVIFTETIEHITFNPVKFWSLIYKKLKPGGKIIITTPNYFFYKGALANDLKRMVKGFSSGISNYDILNLPDYAPHWKEFSAKDMAEYFSFLSTDFRVTKICYNDLYGYVPVSTLYSLCRKFAPRFFHRTMYIEVCLDKKEAGIQVRPDY